MTPSGPDGVAEPADPEAPVDPNAELAGPPSARRANCVLAVLFIVFVFNFIDRNILNILAEPIRLDLGIGDAEIGLLAAAFALFYTVAAFPLARWADRHNRRNLIAAGLVVWSGMTALCGTARSFGQLVALRVGVGVGEASLTPAAHSLISDYFPPERRGRAFAIYGMGGSIGGTLGYLIGGHVAEAYGWRTAFVVVGLPGILLAVLARFGIREPIRGLIDGRADQPQAPFLHSLHDLWQIRTLRHLMFGSALHAFAIIGVSTFHGVFFMRVHGLGAADAATTLALMGLFGTSVGSYMGGWTCDRAGRRDLRWYLWLPALCTLISVPFAAAFYFAPSVVLAAVLGSITSGLGSFYAGPLVAMTQALVKLRSRSMSSAVFLLANSLIGMGLGPIAVGFLSDGLEPRFGEESIRYALLLVVLTNVWAAAHLYFGARTLRAEVAANLGGDAARD